MGGLGGGEGWYRDLRKQILTNNVPILYVRIFNNLAIIAAYG